MNYLVYENGKLQPTKYYTITDFIPTFNHFISIGTVIEILAYNNGKLMQRITYIANQTSGLCPLAVLEKHVEYFVLGSFH